MCFEVEQATHYAFRRDASEMGVASEEGGYQPAVMSWGTHPIKCGTFRGFPFSAGGFRLTNDMCVWGEGEVAKW
jgi:hypothetical protein